MILNFSAILISFFFVWLSAKILVKSVSSLSHLIHFSPFALSFFVLGLSTSMPEFFISLSSILDKHPEIFAGTLLGGSAMILLFIIPFLTLLSGKIQIPADLSKKNFLFALFVIFLPFLAAFDGKIEPAEGIIMILSYLLLFYFIEKKQNILQKFEAGFQRNKKEEIKNILKIFLSILVLYVSSQGIVLNTVFLTERLGFNTFLVSFLLISLGTNLPELSIAVATAFKKQKSIALGDYLGSTSANTLLFGILALLNGNFAFKDKNFAQSALIFFTGITLFFFFSKSKNNLNRQESCLLLIIYIIFICFKILI